MKKICKVANEPCYCDCRYGAPDDGKHQMAPFPVFVSEKGVCLNHRKKNRQWYSGFCSSPPFLVSVSHFITIARKLANTVGKAWCGSIHGARGRCGCLHSQHTEKQSVSMKKGWNLSLKILLSTTNFLQWGLTFQKLHSHPKQQPPVCDQMLQHMGLWQTLHTPNAHVPSHLVLASPFRSEDT